MSIVVRAIDVGFGNTKYVTGSQAGRIDCALYPSLAFHSVFDRGADVIGGRRKTVLVPIDGMFYEVGPDVELAAGRYRGRNLHDQYTETREYQALWKGALFFMKEQTIDLLVVGLPVKHFLMRRAALEKACTGQHAVGRDRTVVVRKTLVLAQPQGALYHYASINGRLKEVLNERSLIIDAGSRTFDWLVTRGMHVVVELSSSTNRGASDILRTIAQCISRDLGVDFDDLEIIDRALRTNSNPRLFQKPYDLRRFKGLIRDVAEHAVRDMTQHLDNMHAFENIVLVGGAAFLFKQAVVKAFPKHAVLEVKEPIFADVRGFQQAGEDYCAALARKQANRAGAQDVPGAEE